MVDPFIVPASDPRLVLQRLFFSFLFINFITPDALVAYIVSCLWDGAYKRSLAVNRQE